MGIHIPFNKHVFYFCRLPAIKEAILHFEMEGGVEDSEMIKLAETMDTVKEVSYALASEAYEQIRNHGRDNCYGCLNECGGQRDHPCLEIDLEENQAAMAEQAWKRLTGVAVQSVFLANKMDTMGLDIDHILQAETDVDCQRIYKKNDVSVSVANMMAMFKRNIYFLDI